MDLEQLAAEVLQAYLEKLDREGAPKSRSEKVWQTANSSAVLWLIGLLGTLFIVPSISGWMASANEEARTKVAARTDRLAIQFELRLRMRRGWTYLQPGTTHAAFLNGTTGMDTGYLKDYKDYDVLQLAAALSEKVRLAGTGVQQETPFQQYLMEFNSHHIELQGAATRDAARTAIQSMHQQLKLIDPALGWDLR